MKTFYKLINRLEENLKCLDAENKDILCTAEKGIKLCKQTLEKLRASVINKSFKSKSDEIEFFKNIKPRVLSKLIYYVEYLYIESKRPRGSEKSQIKYLDNYIENLQNYFNNNLEFYHYCKRKATHLDEQYFLISNKEIRLNIEAYHFFTDKKFSTSHDSAVATILAYDILITYLKTEINKFENNNMETIINPFQDETKFYWTGHYTELVELAYAIWASGRVNNGNVDIKEVILGLQKLFNIDNKNYYHTFTDIRGRKINPTKFMDILKEVLIKYMKDLDDLKLGHL